MPWKLLTGLNRLARLFQIKMLIWLNRFHQFRQKLWAGNKATNLWKHLNENSFVKGSTEERVINYAIDGTSVCKSFYKRATGIVPGLFDKVVRAVVGNTSHRRATRKSMLVALEHGSPKVRVSVKGVPLHLLTARQRHALTIMDMLFKGQLRSLLTSYLF